jgi:PKD repeat protein
MSDYITVSSSLPVASFSSSPASGNAPLEVKFTDQSTGSPTSWKWNFGDGTYSTASNPVHTYKKAGTYSVSLKVKNKAGSSTKTTSTIVVHKNK